MRQFTKRSCASVAGVAVVLDNHRRACASTSFSANLFHVKIVGKELFPFPTRKFTTDEGENMETLVRHVQETKKKSTVSNIVEWGAAGSPIPAEYGGLELSETAHGVVLEELARNAPASSFLPLVRHLGPCTYLIKTFGNKELKARYLAAMSDATMRMAWAATELHAGMDVSMNTTVAKAHEDGSFTISGSKLVLESTTDPAAAFTHLVVMAKAPTQTTGPDGNPVPAQKATFFIVDRNAKGVRLEPATNVSATAAVSPLIVHFDDALALDMIGAAGEGHVQFMVTLHSTHHVLSALLTGLGKRAIGLALQSLAKADGAQLGGSTQLHAMVSSAAAEMYALEATLFALTGNLDNLAQDSLIEATTSAAFIARSVSTTIHRIADACRHTQVEDNSELATLQADLESFLSLCAPESFLYACGASCGTEDFGIYFQKASTLEMMQNRAMRGMGIRDRIPVPQATTWAECKLIEDAVIAFGAAVEQVFVRNNIRARYQTLLLDRLGESAALIYAATAAVSRVIAAESKNVESAKVERKLASVFIQRAMARVALLTDECRNTGKTADETYKRIAAEVCERAFQAAGGVFVEPPPPPVPEVKATAVPSETATAEATK